MEIVAVLLIGEAALLGMFERHPFSYSIISIVIFVPLWAWLGKLFGKKEVPLPNVAAFVCALVLLDIIMAVGSFPYAGGLFAR